MYSLALLGALAGSALSQAITYANTSFVVPVTVGATWDISFSEGTGEDVTIAFGNSSYAFYVVEGLAAPGMYPWTVAVPVNVVSGVYQLALLQGEEDPVFSPSFQLNIPIELASQTTDAPTTSIAFPSVTTTTATTVSTTTVTAIYLSGPTGLTQMNGTYLNGSMANLAAAAPVTYIYWEESCGCHQTGTVDAAALPTSMSTTTVTYHDPSCGCTKTVEAPCAETAIPVPMPMSASPAVPAAVPATTTPAAPVAPVTSAVSIPAAFTGGVGRVVAGSLGGVALVGALVLV